MSHFSVCCHQTHWEAENIPSATQTCASLCLCLLWTSGKPCLLRGPSEGVTAFPSSAQGMAQQQTPQTHRELQSSCRSNEGTDTAVENSHLHYCKYPPHSADSCMFTPSVWTSSPPISNLLVPKRTQSWGQRDSCTSEPCVQGNRQGAYLYPKLCSRINILNLSPGHVSIFTAKFPLVICL